jgi:SSS family solute:Na+ symporter
LIPYTSLQFVGISLLLSREIDFASGIIFSAIITALWAFLGGMRSVAWTDAISGVFMMFMAILPAFYAFQMLPDRDFSKLGELLYVPNSFWRYDIFIAYTLPWFFFALTNPQVVQRIFIPKDIKSLKRMVILFGFYGLFYTVFVTFIGLQLRLLTEYGVFPRISDRDLVMPKFLELLPPWLSVLVALSIFAAAITTADSIVLTLSSMFTRDLLNNRSVLAGRILVVLTTVAIAVFAIQRPAYIVDLAVMSSTILLCQLPLILGIFHWNFGKEFSAIVTLITGFSIAIFLYYTKLTLGIPIPVWVLIFSFAVFFLSAEIEKRFIVHT